MPHPLRYRAARPRVTAVLATPPALEPVGLAEAKAHLKVEHTQEDALIGAFIVAARAHVEALTRRVLVEQGWRVVLDDWPAGGTVDLPVAPLLSLDAVTLYDAEGAPTSLPPTAYVVDALGVPPRLVLREAARPRPGALVNGVEIELTAGYGASPVAVPQPLREAILILVAHWHADRDGIASPDGVMPLGVASLVAPFKILAV